MPWCAACGTRVVSLGRPFCLECRAAGERRACRRERHLRLLSAVQYGEEVAALVRAVKYQGLELQLDAWLAVWVAAVRAPPRPDLLVPVPIHATRRRERGLDVPARWTARLAAWHGVPHAPAARRRRATRTQIGLDRGARQRNLEGAFEAGPSGRAVATAGRV